MKTILLIFSIFALSCAENSSVVNETSTNKMSIKQADTSIYSKAEIIKVINFKHNSTIVDSKDKELLKYLSGICSSDSLSYVKIFAFTDTIGAEKHNDKLAEKRAMLVYKSLGLDKYKTNNCIYVEWLGESAETYDLHFDSAHPQQNCVDIWIMTRKKQNVSRSR